MRTFHAVTIGLAGVIVQGQLWAQTPAWSIPSDGFVYDSPSSGIRSVVGLGGSAYLGPSILSGLDSAFLAPNQHSGLVVRNGSLLWVADLLAPDNLQSLDWAFQPQQVFWSSDSSRAVILTPADRLIWLANFGSSLAREAGWILKSSGRGGVAAERPHWSLLAADSSAGNVLLAFGTANASELWFASASSPPVQIPWTGRAVAAVFTSGKTAAFVLDAAANRIVRIENLGATPTVTTILSSEPYLSGAVGIVLSTDDSRLFAADGAGQTVRVFDSGAGTLLAELPAAANPVSLVAVSPTRFILNGNAGASQPLFFLDTLQPARVFFIPRGE
jgi:hypothetical protein